jgi:hypothetical protein
MGGSPDRSMATAAGQALLAHELAHVAQAKRGLFRAARVEGMPFAEEHGDDHADAEHDAERFEAEELAAHSGQGEGGPAASPAEQAAARERRDQRIIARALELLAESGRLDELRNGERFPGEHERRRGRRGVTAAARAPDRRGRAGRACGRRRGRAGRWAWPAPISTA